MIKREEIEELIMVLENASGSLQYLMGLSTGSYNSFSFYHRDWCKVRDWVQKLRTLSEEYPGGKPPDPRLEAFLYLLLRDHVTPGQVEKVMEDLDDNTVLSNKFLADYASHLAAVLRENP